MYIIYYLIDDGFCLFCAAHFFHILTEKLATGHCMLRRHLSFIYAFDSRICSSICMLISLFRHTILCICHCANHCYTDHLYLCVYSKLGTFIWQNSQKSSKFYEHRALICFITWHTEYIITHNYNRELNCCGFPFCILGCKIFISRFLVVALCFAHFSVGFDYYCFSAFKLN